MNIIDSYQFGLIVVNGKKYTSDVIIFPDSVTDNWWRRTGHQLCLDDIVEVLAENPQVLVVGIGASGLMKVLPEVRQLVEAQGIELIVEATDKACHTYNQFCHSRRAVAALHLTC
ncbi:hypothetical protein ES705_25514 [subsurface metagenome]